MSDPQFERVRVDWRWAAFALMLGVLLWAQGYDLWQTVFGCGPAESGQRS